jgi:hypothetical protein
MFGQISSIYKLLIQKLRFQVKSQQFQTGRLRTEDIKSGDASDNDGFGGIVQNSWNSWFQTNVQNSWINWPSHACLLFPKPSNFGVVSQGISQKLQNL